MSSDPELAALTFTPNARLDSALGAGWPALERAIRSAEATKLATWLEHRLGPESDAIDLARLTPELQRLDSPADLIATMAEIAEVAEVADPLLADTLWEGILAAGIESGDGEIIFDAVTHLAASAEAFGDPLTAAEYLLTFLNWRRSDDNASDPDAVHAAFEQVVRLAESDGNPAAAARFQFSHATFGRLSDNDDPRAERGEWESTDPPYQPWA